MISRSIRVNFGRWIDTVNYTFADLFLQWKTPSILHIHDMYNFEKMKPSALHWSIFLSEFWTDFFRSLQFDSTKNILDKSRTSSILYTFTWHLTMQKNKKTAYTFSVFFDHKLWNTSLSFSKCAKKIYNFWLIDMNSSWTTSQNI